MERIQKEYEAAKLKFPSLNQTSPQTYEIIFQDAPNLNYTIILPENYPNQPPTAQLNDAPVQLPIIGSWMELFQLEHLLIQLNEHAKIPQPKIYNLNDSELMNALNSAPLDQLQNINENSPLITNLSFVKDSNAEAQKVQTLDKIEDDLSLAQVKAIDAATAARDTYDTLNMIKQEIQKIDPNSPQAKAAAVQAKVQALRAEAQAVDQEINQLINNPNRDLGFYKELNRLKEKQQMSRFIADEVEKQMPL